LGEKKKENEEIIYSCCECFKIPLLSLNESSNLGGK